MGRRPGAGAARAETRAPPGPPARPQAWAWASGRRRRGPRSDVEGHEPGEERQPGPEHRDPDERDEEAPDERDRPTVPDERPDERGRPVVGRGDEEERDAQAGRV